MVFYIHFVIFWIQLTLCTILSTILSNVINYLTGKIDLSFGLKHNLKYNLLSKSTSKSIFRPLPISEETLSILVFWCCSVISSYYLESFWTYSLIYTLTHAFLQLSTKKSIMNVDILVYLATLGGFSFGVFLVKDLM
jgi:putative flippase GtrA